MKNFKSHSQYRQDLGAFLWLMEGVKEDFSVLPAFFKSRAGPEIDLIPETLPVFVKPGVKIGRDGKIENISEFKSWNDIFDFSRCLGCAALQREYYGSSGESPCMKCHSLVNRIKEKNYMGQKNFDDTRPETLPH